MPDGSLRIEVLDSAFESMTVACEQAGSRETGGILIGTYSSNGRSARVIEALPPTPDSTGGASTFRRGTVGLRKELNARWRESGTYYIGEWHYHPLGSGYPSDADVIQMIAFAREERMQTPVPVLATVNRGDDDQFDLRVSVFTRHGEALVLRPVSGTGP